MSPKVEKSIILFSPPLPPGGFGFFFWIWGKFEIWWSPLPLGPNLGKIWNEENFEFLEPPSEKKLIVGSTEAFHVYIYIWEKSKNTDPPHIKKFKFWMFDFLIFSAHPPPFWTFSTFSDNFIFKDSPNMHRTNLEVSGSGGWWSWTNKFYNLYCENVI